MELAAAEALLDVGRAEEARRRVAAALAAQPDNVEALCLLARCHVELDDQSSALDAATAAVGLDPACVEAHILRGSALVALDRAKDALAAANRAVELAPDRAAAHLVRALALFNSYRRRAAWAAMHEVTRLAPHWADAHVIHGSLHHTLGNYRRARRAYRRALALRPDHAGALEGLGHLALRSGRIGAAVRQFGAAAALSPVEQSASEGVDKALTGLYGWGFIAAWTVLVVLGMAGQFPLAWAIAGGVTLAYTGWLWLFRHRLPPPMRTAARARLGADPRQWVRVRLAVLTVAVAVLVGGVEALYPVPPNDGGRPLLGLFGGIGWLLVAGGTIAVVDIRRVNRQSAAGVATLGPDQQTNVQIGRLVTRWTRTTALVAIVPSVLAAEPAAPWDVRAPVGTALIGLLWWYYVWSVRRWRRSPGRPLSPGVAHLLPAAYFALGTLWIGTFMAAFWPGQPPYVALVGLLLGLVVGAVALPVRLVRLALRRFRRR